MMIASTLTTKGQVTIPKSIRETLHLMTGDKIEFVVSSTNEVVLKPVTKKSSDVFGMLAQYKKVPPVSIEDMNEGIKQHLKKKYHESS